MSARKEFSMADRAALFFYLLKNGLPEWPELGGPADRQELAFAILADISQDEARAAFVEAAQAGFVGRADSGENEPH